MKFSLFLLLVLTNFSLGHQLMSNYRVVDFLVDNASDDQQECSLIHLADDLASPWSDSDIRYAVIDQ